jgi:glycerophosphoryl diester phosphodiesterase
MPARSLGAALASAALAALVPFGTLAFDLQGHRGARGLAPENTLPAFAAALSLGVTTLELDTGVTADGVVVVTHEPRLHPDTTRGPDGAWLAAHGPTLRSLTYAELARYDVGRLNPATNYGKRYPQQKPVDGTRIPRLADLFALVQRSGNSTVRFNIETKIDPRAPDLTLPPEAFARALVKAIREAGMASRASIQSFDWRTLRVVQAEAPEIPTVYLTAQQKWLDNVGAGAPAGSAWTAGFQHAQAGSVPKMVRAAGGKTWSPYFGDLDAAQLSEARALGLAVVVWTVNEPADITRMMDLGVDGIISDRPDLVRAEMQKRGMALPPATPVAAETK